MKKQIFESIKGYISDNKRQYAVVIAALVAGMALGCLSALRMSGQQFESLSGYTENFVSSYNLQPVSRSRVFISSAMGNIKTVLFLWVSGLWVGLIPFAIFHIGVKGYKIGFSTAFLVSAYRGRGVLFALMSMLPQMIIFVPALTVFAVFNIRYAASIRRVRIRNGARSMRREMYLQNAVCVLGILAVVACCSLLDAFIIPPVLKPVCSYMAA